VTGPGAVCMLRAMKHTVTHDLDQETARRVAQKAWESYSERFAKYEPRISWKNDDHAEIGFSAKGIRLDGTLKLRKGEIEMDLDVPFILKVFQKKALQVIDEEIRKWVAKAKVGEI